MEDEVQRQKDNKSAENNLLYPAERIFRPRGEKNIAWKKVSFKCKPRIVSQYTITLD